MRLLVPGSGAQCAFSDPGSLKCLLYTFSQSAKSVPGLGKAVSAAIPRFPRSIFRGSHVLPDRENIGTRVLEQVIERLAKLLQK